MVEKTQQFKYVGNAVQHSCTAGSLLYCVSAQLGLCCIVFLHSWFPAVYFAYTAGDERVQMSVYLHKTVQGHTHSMMYAQHTSMLSDK